MKVDEILSTEAQFTKDILGKIEYWKRVAESDSSALKYVDALSEAFINYCRKEIRNKLSDANEIVIKKLMMINNLHKYYHETTPS